MAGPDHALPEPGPEASADDLQDDIEQTRADLVETTQALTAKLDVKARATEAASHAKDRVLETSHDVKDTVITRTTTTEGSIKPAFPLAAAAIVVAVLGIVVWRRRRS
ncbi:MAG: hypothetical protein JWR11_197 [Mycobacterium sp.]|nr:hypothetical protein [Mycobacterium sp.]